ncbi:MAG: DbpA RNA binding domain-containing protein, partial [Myxococcales bacterium]|nr:DbpA RNA binding domain-containing protein [Myxococcales bacterium]
MLDMGFEADMDQILGALPRERQSALFSATFPDAIDALSRAHLRDPARVCIDEAQQAGPEIEQRVLMTAAADESKYAALLGVLDRHPCPSALVFCNLKATVAELTRALAAEGLSVACLHGDLEQFDRNRVMAMFRNHSVRLLIATDVAARGLDVEDLELVINYDLPRQAETYLHRIGRTGRAGKSGLAVSLASARERGLLDAIARLTGTPLPRSDAPSPDEGSGERRRQAWAASMDTIQISGGRKQKVRPGDILGALTGEAGGLAAADVGKIEIHDHLAHVAVAKTVSRAAVRALDNGRIKGKRFRATLVRA